MARTYYVGDTVQYKGRKHTITHMITKPNGDIDACLRRKNRHHWVSLMRAGKENPNVD